jgi:hypothetical protein
MTLAGDRRTGWLAQLRRRSVAQLVIVAGVWLLVAGLLSAWFGAAGGTHRASLVTRATIVTIGWYAAAAGLAIALVGVVSARRRYARLWPPSCADAGERVAARAWLWGLIAGITLALYPLFVALSRNPYRDAVWLAWGFEDYRWLIALYFVTIATVVALPPLAARWLEPATPLPDVGHQRRHWWPRAVLALAFGIAVSLMLFAPPWNLASTSGEIGNHDVHLSQLQAIHTGSLPYIGPASIQYGPGSQLLQYAYMTVTGRFSLLGYRETYPLFLVIAFACFTATVAGTLGVGYGTLAALLALFISPFNMLSWNGDTLTGFLGWANALRYVGAFVVVGLLPSVLRRATGGFSGAAFLVGLVWGTFTWLSQENLMSTLLGGGLFVVTAWALSACSLAQVRRTVVGLVLGWLLVVVPILLFYRSHGELARFVEGYFLVTRFVAAGMSNTPWDWRANAGWNAAFVLTPLVLFGAAVLTTFDWPQRRFASPLSPDRQQALAFVGVSLVCFTGALLRKDSSHFQNALIGLPATIAALAAVVVNERRRAWRPLLVLPLLGAFVLLFPDSARIPGFLVTYVATPWAARLQHHAPDAERSAWQGQQGVAFERAGAFISADYRIFENGPPARTFLTAMNDLKATVDSRRVYVQSFPGVPPESVYFLADLTPGPLLFSVSTMVFNTDVQRRFFEDMRVHCQEFDAVVGVELEAPEVQIFKDCHPGVVPQSARVGDEPYYVWLASAPRN